MRDPRPRSYCCIAAMETGNGSMNAGASGSRPGAMWRSPWIAWVRAASKPATGRAPNDSAEDAYRALNFLVRDPLVDPDRVAVIGFANGGRVALMSVERGHLEQASPAKFRAAVAFYPSCLGLKGDMTAPTLILIGELDDWAPGQGMPQFGRGPRRLGDFAAEGPGRADQADRASRRLSRIRCSAAHDAADVEGASSRIQPGGDGSIVRGAARISRRDHRRKEQAQ